ncbi:MAG: nucleotidyltransferase family protein [Candidatus Lokiarchaeota archaeon]|nr:nucleotidyltransferase family protein [Candidatus Lokiarchaeota archaeon]
MESQIDYYKDLIVPILKEYGVIKASLFGSIVRREMTKDSDIDILVEFQDGKTLLDLVGLQNALIEKLERKVDVITFNSIHPLLKERILKEQVKIL